MLHGAELRQEALALRLAAERVDHPGRHVVDRDVGGGRGAALRQLLEDDGGVEPRQRGAADVVLARRCRRSRAPPPVRSVSTGKISSSSQSRACGIISSRAKSPRRRLEGLLSSVSSKSIRAPSAMTAKAAATRPQHPRNASCGIGESAGTATTRRVRGEHPWPSNTAVRSRAKVRFVPVETGAPATPRST